MLASMHMKPARSLQFASLLLTLLPACLLAADSWFASVKTAEMLKQKGLDFIGDIKMGTARFPAKVIKMATPPGPGDWATYTSEIKLDNDELVPIYAVSHRRGQSIHSFIATCGTTIRGKSIAAYFEDDEERCNANVQDFEIERKAPRVLNDFTLAQPTSDRHNRYRQVSCFPPPSAHVVSTCCAHVHTCALLLCRSIC